MSTVGLALAVAAWCAGWALVGRARWLRPAPAAPGGTVSVVVPARDEATRLPRLLHALGRASTHELVVVDDGSRDDTAAIATRAGARVVTPGEPPPGWTGKTWACAAGAEAATGDVLVFLDADVEPAPPALDALADAAHRSGGLVSAQPLHRVDQLYERLSAGPALVTLLGAGTGCTRERARWRGPVAFGPAMAVRRDVYRAFGGHGAAPGAVDDDLALARAAHAAGVAVVALLAGDLVRYRIYPGGAKQLVEGWTKNLATGAGAIPPARLVACVLWVTGALSAALALVTAPTPLAALAYGAFALQAHVALRRVGRFGAATPLLYPLALLAFVALFGASLLATRGRRRVRWRGREIATGPVP